MVICGMATIYVFDIAIFLELRVIGPWICQVIFIRLGQIIILVVRDRKCVGGR